MRVPNSLIFLFGLKKNRFSTSMAVSTRRNHSQLVDARRSQGVNKITSNKQEDQTEYSTQGLKGKSLKTVCGRDSEQSQGRREARGSGANSEEKDYIKVYFLENAFEHSHLK